MFDDLKAYCMFIGYPRSGHTLIGSLLNAHPDAVICHELDALGYVHEGASRQELFQQILDQDEEFAAKGRVHVYNFTVSGPGSWQGRWRKLRIIGDKKGSKSARWLYSHPELLNTLSERVGLPVRLLHVIRSPWDNIATIARRGATDEAPAEQHLEAAFERYFTQSESVRRVRARQPAPALLDVYHEDFIDDPGQGLRSLCDFLEIEPDEAWIEASRAIVYTRPNRSRFAVTWPDEMIDRVRQEMDRFDWLRPDHRDFGEPTDSELAVSS